MVLGDSRDMYPTLIRRDCNRERAKVPCISLDSDITNFENDLDRYTPMFTDALTIHHTRLQRQATPFPSSQSP